MCTKEVLMNIEHMVPASTNRLETHLALGDFLVAEVGFEYPPKSFFVAVNGEFLLDFKSVVKFD